MATFLASFATKAERLDTQLYLASGSADEALQRWYGDLVDELGYIVQVFSQVSWDEPITAPMLLVNEKNLERENRQFLNRLLDFLQRAQEILASKAVQYGKICSRFSKSRELGVDIDKVDLKEGGTLAKRMDNACVLLNRFCVQRIEEGKRRRVNDLGNFWDHFAFLEKLSTINRPQLISDMEAIISTVTF